MQTQTDTETKMIPTDAIRLLRRLRATGPCKIGVQFDSHMPTEDGKLHTYPTLLDGVTLQQATHLLEDMQRIHETMREISETVPLVNVKVHVNEENKNEKIVVLG